MLAAGYAHDLYTHARAPHSPNHQCGYCTEVLNYTNLIMDSNTIVAQGV